MNLPDWVGQIIALLVVPAIIVVSMALSASFYIVIKSMTTNLGGFGSFMSTILALGIFIGGIWFAFIWTRTQGMGWFKA